MFASIRVDNKLPFKRMHEDNNITVAVNEFLLVVNERSFLVLFFFFDSFLGTFSCEKKKIMIFS